MTVTELIQANQAKPGTTKVEKTRFMLELDSKLKDDLMSFCKDDLGCGAIKFASELFEVAFKDAQKAFQTLKQEAAKVKP